MKKIIKFIFIITVLIINSEVFAATCPSTTKKELKNEASKVEYTLEPEVKTVPGEGELDVQYALYTLTFLNLTDNLRVRWSYDNDNYSFLYKGQNTIDDLYQSSIIYVDIISVRPEGCEAIVLKKFKIELLDYNPNSKNEECKDYPNFTYCKEYLSTKYDLNDKNLFNEKLKEYKKNLKNKETVNGNTIESNNNLFAIIVFILIMLGSLITSLAIIINSIKEKKQENSLM